MIYFVSYICQIYTSNLLIFYPKGQYKYIRGCKDIHRLGLCTSMGRSCASENKCVDCTFGKCIQLAKEKDSKGFSYSKRPNGTSYCRLCTMEQLRRPQDDFYSVVYQKIGKFRNPIQVLFILQTIFCQSANENI